MTLAKAKPSGLAYKIEPWAHQQEAIDRAAERECFALFFEMGTGKTLTAINILRHHWLKAKSLRSTLVLAPPIVLQNWKDEFLKNSDVEAKRLVILRGTGKERLEALLAARFAYKDRFIAITNYETLLMPKVIEALRAWAPECLVADESHRCKDIKAKRTKALIALADLADRCRLILTGTPVLNSPMDLFAQYRILDRGESFGTNFFAFRNNYFVDKNAFMARTQYFPDWKPRLDTLGKINALLAETGMSVKKEDCLDLPPLTRQVITVELSAQQQKLYREMRDDFITFLGDKACIAELAITKALRLQQIVSGHISLKDEDGGTTVTKLKDNPRAEALKELLANISSKHKVLVWACFRENYAVVREVCKQLDLGYTEVHGDIHASVKQAAVESFRDDPAIRVLIGHPGSGGIGVNLTAASYSIFYSRNFSLEHDLQAEARNHRGGSEVHRQITRIDLVATGTLDEVIAKALAEKKEIGEKLLRTIAHQL